ncbi:MAG: methyltransferase domain-containing protein [Candidatus Aminicenantes bacterium]|nr:methyltransferase domain-containing protein [Candidatus Aminicenantes bacterium]
MKRFSCFSWLLAAAGVLAFSLLVISQEYDWGALNEEGFEKDHPTGLIMKAIGVEKGMTVAEVGAGGGRVAVRVARIVGPSGWVYANDITESALAYMRARVEREAIPNMTVVEGTLTDPRLPAGEMDVVYLTFTYRHLDRPVEVLRNIGPSLKPGGVLAIIESKDFAARPGKNEIIENAVAAGYTLQKMITSFPEDDIYLFAQ